MTTLQVPFDGWTVDDLGGLPEELPCELVDGGLLVSPSPSVRHGAVQVRLAAALLAQAPAGRLAPADVLLVVEVMSPGSVSTDRVAKPAQYAAAGIPAHWRLEQDEGVLVTHVLDGDTYRETGRHTGAAVVEEPFRVELDVADLLV